MTTPEIPANKEGDPLRTGERRYLMMDGTCKTCDKYKVGEMMPWHDASYNCESGRRTHCTCDVCF